MGGIARKWPGIKEENHEELYRRRPVQCAGRYPYRVPYESNSRELWLQQFAGIDMR